MKKRILAALLTVIMTMTVICVPNVIAEATNNDEVIKNDEMGIPDTALYNVILNVADSNGDEILTVSEAEQITRLTVNPDTSKDDVKNLQGIKYCKGLQSLSIQFQEVEDISELAYLTNLKYLNLYDNNITDITALSNLKKLTDLNLEYNDITDITALSALTNLEFLNLGHSQINELTALANLSKLRILRVSNETIDDITALSSLTSLEELTLWGLRINDISPLSKLKKLYALELGSNEISDITALEGLTELKYLYLQDNNISDLSALKNLTKLEYLELSNNRIRDISVLDMLPESCAVYVECNPIGMEEPIIWNAADGIPDSRLFEEIVAVADENEDGFLTIKEAESVTKLEIEFKEIKDLLGIDMLSNLEYLDLSNNDITDITALSNLEKLNYLDLSYNKITDASAISQLPNLEYLNLEGNPCETEKPTEPGTPDDPTTPEPPSTPEQPSNPNTPEIEDAPVIESYTDTQVVLDVTEKPVIKKAYFEAIVQLNNEHDYEVVFHAGDDVYITFGKGTMNMIDGIEDYDFTVDINPDYDSSKVPTTLGKESFVSKVIYNYSGKLPAMASIRIPVGTEYAEKTLYYTLLNEDSTFGTSQKVVVDKDGYISVNQDHCSSYVITTKDMSVKETTPNTGDNTSIVFWMMVLAMGGCLCFIGAKKKNII